MTQKALKVSWETELPGGHDRLVPAMYSSTKALTGRDEVGAGVSSLKVNSGIVLLRDAKRGNPGLGLRGKKKNLKKII